jgi:tetratricopeptide (TPR) repeat protein
MIKKLSIVVAGLALAFQVANNPLQAQSTAEGLRALDNEQYSSARTIFQSLVNAKASPETHFYLGYFYNRIGKPDSANISFNKGLALDPKFAFNELGLGNSDLQNGNRAAAQEHFTKALTISKGKNPDIMYFIADAWLRAPKGTKDPVEAIKLLDQAILKNPKRVDYFVLRGDAFGEQNDGSQAVANFNQALNIEPENVKVMVRKGKFYERAKNYTEAAKLYRESIAKDPKYAIAYKELGEVLYLAKRYDEALQNYEQYINISDKNQTSMLLYAEFLIRSKKYPQSVAVITDLKAKDPNNPLLYRGLAFTQFETGDFKGAKENLAYYFEKQTDKSKITANDSLYSGKIGLKSGGDTLASVNMIADVVKRDTSKADEAKIMAKELFDAKAYIPAAVLYKAVTDNVKKLNNLDYYNLGRSYYYANDYVNSDATFAKNYEMFPTFYTALYYQALSQYLKDKDGSQGLAVPYFEQYIEKETDKVKYKPYFVRAYNACGSYYSTIKKNKAKSIDFFTKALEVDPNNAPAKEGLKFAATIK